MMTSKITKKDITNLAFNQGSLGMEFSWNYERQMHIAFAMMMNPMAFPKTNWKYLNCISGLPTCPGTEIKVTPESAVPIIPKATKYHFEFLLALKKASFPLSFLLTK